ncbi:MAG: glycosyltransferase family 2 protein, partial [Candidatus Competibacteraceae bacterium]|nr:glycosyltransferase family 2 protein [Candidatus Competibacteraceae bacterium]
MNQSVSEHQSGGSTSPAVQLPLVSVIIPAYNAEEYVLEALHSVLGQDYEPVEILVIDDGSSDGTVDLVRRETPRVKIVQQTNAGAAAARNTG